LAGILASRAVASPIRFAEDPRALVSGNASPEDLEFLEKQVNEDNYATTGKHAVKRDSTREV